MTLSASPSSSSLSPNSLIRKPAIWMLLGLILSLVSPILAVGFGAASISFSEVTAALLSVFGLESELSAIKERIILELRLPRVLLAFLCGAGLSLAGAVLQTVTRNPLADPYLFGISSGASFGAVLVIAAMTGGALPFGSFTLNDTSFNTVEWLGPLSQYGITLGAFIGSALSVLLVVSLAGTGVQIERMLLSGVAVSFMFSAGTSLVLYASDPQAAASLLFWTLGSFSSAGWDNVVLPAVVVAGCMLVFLAFSRPLRTVLAGDENAKALGIDVRRLRFSMLLCSSLLTATLVANCGGIGFVGLMVPHIVRRLMWQQSRYVYSACLLFGGVFMVWVDVLARVLVSNSELPIGVITAAIGSVFFLLVLRRRNA